MRNPAMHIRYTDFIKVLNSVGIPKPNSTALAIFKAAVPFNIRDRYVVNGNADTQRKANRVITASKASSITVPKFHMILNSERAKVGHKYFQPILQSSPNYLMLKEVCQLAVTFATQCGFDDIYEGCRVYVYLGLDRMKRNYGLNRFKTYDSYIYQQYEFYDLITNDVDKERSKEVCNTYIKLLIEYAGIERDDFDKPENFVNFVYTREVIDREQANIEDWIRAQFVEFSKYPNSPIPSPNQLCTDKSVDRYYTYMTQENLSSGDDVIWAAPSNDFEQKYQEALKLKTKTLIQHSK
jgi:hypothetical protein